VRVVLSLSDPWELGEALGWRPIRGVVTHQELDSWLIKIDAPFVHSDLEYQYVVISARHSGASLDQLRSQQVPCNVVRTTPERAQSETPCDVSWWRGGGAIIGTIVASEE